MRILSILPFSPPSAILGGAERQMHSLHQGLLARGVEVHVLADIKAVGCEFQNHEGLSIWGVPFPILTSHPLRPGNIKLWLVWRAIRRVVTTKVPRMDLIQVTTFRQSALVGYWLSRELDVPWIARLACSQSYGDMRFSLANWLSRRQLPRMVKAVSRVIALEEETRKEAIASGVPQNRVVIIPNGLVLRHLPASNSEHYGGGDQSILYVGRLAQQKRVDTMLDAYKRLREVEQHAPPLVIAGDGEVRLNLEQQAKRLGISERCKFLGHVASPETVLERASCFINPSESEGLPNAVLEAMAFGVPVILSDIPAHRKLAIEGGMEDFLFSVGDAGALAERLKLFLGLDKSAKEKRSRRCADFGREFLPGIRDQAYYDLYRQVLAEEASKCC